MTDSKAAASKQLLAGWIPRAEGWLTVERAFEMYDLVRQIQPQYVVEIGVFGGRSLIAQALALKDIGRGKIIGIDPWKKETAVAGQTDETQAAWWRDVDYYKIHQGCMEWVWAFGLDQFVTVIRGASEDCADIMPPTDILYIDGLHSEEASCRDVRLYLQRVKQNGYVWADDMDWDSTQKAKELLKADCVVVKDCGGYMLFCKK